MNRDSHLSLSIGHALWEELFRRALPITVQDGSWEARAMARGALRQLELRQRVAGLLEDRQPPPRLQGLARRARQGLSRGRRVLSRRVDDLIVVDGTWKVQLDDAGTELRYGHQRIEADAFVRGTVEGTLHLLGRNVEIPFTLTRRVGASLALADVHYSAEREGVVGELRDLTLHIGDNHLLQLGSRLVEQLLQPQLAGLNPTPILRREQLEGLVGPLGGPLRMNMGIDMMDVVIDEDQLTLKVRFGFTQPQLERT